MIIVADSGATKTDWLFCDNTDKSPATTGRDIPTTTGRDIMSVKTHGINAATMSSDAILPIVDDLVAKAGTDVADKVESIYFYGAGCITEQQTAPLGKILGEKFRNIRHLEIESDMAGAAKALFGDGKGVTAILGTGSNSCLWENGRIVRNILPGGFILGDEGSGASLGKMFLADYFKDLVPERIREKANRIFDISYQDAVMKIYKGDTPSRYLASFARFIVENKSDEYAAELIERNIRNFIERSLARYGETKVGVVGSLGFACREELAAIGSEYGLEFVKFLASPIESLTDYHLAKYNNSEIAPYIG